jgi:hypothetical protein
MRRLLQADSPLAPALCPKCGELINSWTETGGGRKPKPGDAAICAYCIGVSVYDADLKPVPPSPEHLAAFAASPSIQQVLKALRARKLEEALKPPSQRGLMPRA